MTAHIPIAAFIVIGAEKRAIVHAFDGPVNEQGWAWLMIEEGAERMVVEFRKVPDIAPREGR